MRICALRDRDRAMNSTTPFWLVEIRGRRRLELDRQLLAVLRRRGRAAHASRATAAIAYGVKRPLTSDSRCSVPAFRSARMPSARRRCVPKTSSTGDFVSATSPTVSSDRRSVYSLPSAGPRPAGRRVARRPRSRRRVRPGGTRADVRGEVPEPAGRGVVIHGDLGQAHDAARRLLVRRKWIAARCGACRRRRIPRDRTPVRK